MAKVLEIKGRQILDSRGNPTVEAEVKTENGRFRGIAPSGASTGSKEALELRDKSDSYAGKSVMNAVSNINTLIAKNFAGLDCEDLYAFDNAMIELDGTENKAKLGANATTAVSIAVARAGAASRELELYEFLGEISGNNKFRLPIPQLNIINGGKHAGMENDVQEHMIMPVNANSFSEALEMCALTYFSLREILKKEFGSSGTNIADEGGFAPAVKDLPTRLELINQAIENAGFQNELKLALDCAASEFYYNGTYKVGIREFTPGELIDYYSELTNQFKIISIEDGLSENDWSAWTEMTGKLGNKIQIVGDDLLVTNPKIIEEAISKKACNALLLKVNQIGTVTESIDAAKLAFKNNWKVIVSHRSGESEDSFIADLTVGIGANQSKFGAPARSDRNAKYNQLLRIEESLGGSKSAEYSKF